MFIKHSHKKIVLLLLWLLVDTDMCKVCCSAPQTSSLTNLHKSDKKKSSMLESVCKNLFSSHQKHGFHVDERCKGSSRSWFKYENIFFNFSMFHLSQWHLLDINMHDIMLNHKTTAFFFYTSAANKNYLKSSKAHTHTYAHTDAHLTLISWQPLTDKQLMSKHRFIERTPFTAINTWAAFGLCTQSKHFLTNTAVRSERTHLSPRIHRAVTTDTDLSSCARALWVAARSSLGALLQLMRAGRTKKGVEKKRRRSSYGRGLQMESLLFVTHICCLLLRWQACFVFSTATDSLTERYI